MSKQNEELSPIRKEIKYRVEEEYKKYHNDHTFKWNGKDFWIEQIIWKLGETLEAYLDHHISKAVIEENEYWREVSKSLQRGMLPIDFKDRIAELKAKEELSL